MKYKCVRCGAPLEAFSSYTICKKCRNKEESRNEDSSFLYSTSNYDTSFSSSSYDSCSSYSSDSSDSCGDD